MFLRALIPSVLLVWSAGAFAGDESGTPTSVSLSDLQAKCAELSANPQLKPIKVKITCNELSYHWVAAPAKEGSLANQRNVGALVEMKGYEVPHAFFPIQVAPLAVQCQAFVKNERQVKNIDTEIGCTDLAAITDLGAFCAPMIDQRVAQDPSLVTDTATQDTVTLCPPSGN